MRRNLRAAVKRKGPTLSDLFGKQTADNRSKVNLWEAMCLDLGEGYIAALMLPLWAEKTKFMHAIEEWHVLIKWHSFLLLCRRVILSEHDNCDSLHVGTDCDHSSCLLVRSQPEAIQALAAWYYISSNII